MILDGGSGACLIRAGLPSGVCPELWALENPAPLRSLQHNYVAAGSDVVCSFTFGANRVKLAAHGLEARCAELNRSLVAVSREAVGSGTLIAGDIGPTGLLPQPFGDADFDMLFSVFSEQASALAEGGADYIAVETMMSLTEAKAALLAAKTVTELPVCVSITCGSNGRTLTGCTPSSALIVLQAAGADGFGLNCSLPPALMLPLFDPLPDIAKINLTAKPNGEYPDADGNRVFVSPDNFAAEMKKFVSLGVAAVGGCCGSEPEHIAALSDALAGVAVVPPRSDRQLLASERDVYALPDPDTLAACGIYSPDALLDAVDADESVIRLRISSDGDAQTLSQMLLYANAPVSLVVSETEPALRAAGICPARFLLDPESPLSASDRETLTHSLFASI